MNGCICEKNGETFTVNGATGLGDFSDGLAYAKMGEKVGFVNDKGEWTIEAKFDKVRDFQAGYAAVRVGEKWGVINKKGEFVVEPKFYDIKNFSKVK
ncbi:MAG: WG repeat-containing protein [Crocinitomicaceae bacterium]|nr:WG repeat-containing protein [Crocinitomicaceae bacterium]